MRRFLSIVLLAALCAGLTLPMAAAEEASYPCTQAYLSFLDSKGMSYKYIGKDNSGDEQVTIDLPNYTINYFFSEDQTLVSIRVWYLITYDKAREADVIALCSKFNYDYKYAAFIADTSDNTVTVRADVIHRTTDLNDALWSTTSFLVNIIDDAYSELEQYNIDA